MRFTLILLLSYVASGCAGLIKPATRQLAEDLSAAILQQNDLATVEAGAPAYLLMLDGFINGDPENVDLLQTGAKVYTAYAATFVKDKPRSVRLTQRGLDYAQRALCIEIPRLCQTLQGKYLDYLQAMGTLGKADVPVVYRFASSWAARIGSDTDDWKGLAELPKIQAAMERVVELDEGYDYGGAHMVLGILDTRLPPALGGKPESGRDHFERVIVLSEGRHLLAKVIYAERYARMMFDRTLHDRLLREVLTAAAAVPGLTLSNTLAQQRAQELLDSAADYF